MKWILNFEFLNFEFDDNIDEDISFILSSNIYQSIEWFKNKCNRNSLKHDKN